MAEIHVESKKQTTPAWIWILVALAIIAAVVYFVSRNNNTVDNAANDKNTTSYMRVYQPHITGEAA